MRDSYEYTKRDEPRWRENKQDGWKRDRGERIQRRHIELTQKKNLRNDLSFNKQNVTIFVYLRSAQIARRTATVAQDNRKKTKCKQQL